MSTGDVSGGKPGERLIWSGVPAQGLLFTSRDWFMIPFSLLWGGMASFGFGAAVLGGNLLPIVFLTFFAVVALYITVGRFVLDAWMRRRTSYAVTNKRILITRSAPFAKFISVSLDRLPDMSLSERGGGRGMIRFGAQQSMFVRGNGDFSAWAPALDPTPQFIAIEDARSVFDQIQRAAAGVR